MELLQFFTKLLMYSEGDYFPFSDQNQFLHCSDGNTSFTVPKQCFGDNHEDDITIKPLI